MKIHFICGYYSDLAHELKRRTEPYWDAYFYVWAVKVGTFRRSFFAHKPHGNVKINEDNFHLVREWFGDFIIHTLRTENAGDDVLLVPIPSKDGLAGACDYRTLTMLRESLNGRQYSGSISDALRWSEKLQPAHEGGGRSRQFLMERYQVDPIVTDRDVILIDDIISTGSAMLAARDALLQNGANVLGGIVCGKTIYDFETKPFGLQSFILEKELNDYKAE